MNRFKFFTAGFILNLVLYIFFTALQAQEFIGVVNFASFLFSLIYFIFSWEEPPRTDKLVIPEVHNYYRSRQNDYGNIVSIEFALLSFVFFTLLYSTQLNLSLITLILWAISIPVTYLIILYFSKKQELDKIVNYISMFKPELSLEKVKTEVHGFLSLGVLSKKDLLKNAKDFNVAEEIVDLFIYYCLHLDDKLTKEEIEEINKL